MGNIVTIIFKILAINTSFTKQKSPYRKHYAAFLLTFHLIILVWQIRGKFIYMYDKIKTTLAFLDLLAAFFLSGINMYGIISEDFINDGKAEKFYGDLEQVDRFLLAKSQGYENELGKRQIVLMIVGMHFFTAFTFWADVSAITPLYGGLEAFQYNVANYFFVYRIVWFVIQTYTNVRILEDRFDVLHHKMEKIVTSSPTREVLTNCSKCHSSLSGLIDKINGIYGVQLLIFDKIVVLHVVLVVYSLFLIPKDTTAGLSNDMKAWAFIVNLIWCVNFLILGGMISFYCDRTTIKAQKLAVVDVKIGHVSKHQRMWMKQFNRQVTLMKPKFEVHEGIYEVNRRSYLQNVGAMFNFIVIFLQFYE